MTTALITHPASLGHDMGQGHPERPDRLRALQAALDAPDFEMLARHAAPAGSRTAIERVHPPSYVDLLWESRPRDAGLVRLDADTTMSAGTWDALDRAVGGACFAVDLVVGGQAQNAFVATRPPGHHAERTTAMGFCFFNIAAIAARHAQAVHGAERVAIVDFDVHHGNGTQDVFWADGSVLYASTHQMPLYPGTGARGERGDKDTIVNAPLRSGDGGEAFRAAMEGAILPRLLQFSPDLLILSAGFDAHRRDPLAQLDFEASDFAWVTTVLMDVADRCCGGRVVSVLEGGYDLRGLAESGAAHVRGLMGLGVQPSTVSRDTIPTPNPDKPT